MSKASEQLEEGEMVGDKEKFLKFLREKVKFHNRKVSIKEVGDFIVITGKGEVKGRSRGLESLDLKYFSVLENNGEEVMVIFPKTGSKSWNVLLPEVMRALRYV